MGVGMMCPYGYAGQSLGSSLAFLEHFNNDLAILIPTYISVSQSIKYAAVLQSDLISWPGLLHPL